MSEVNGKNLLHSRKGEYDMTERNHLLPVNFTYKARIFEMLYSDKKELLDLYNAVNGTNYKDPEQLEINTLENAIYMAMHNDISFVIDMKVSLYEHQSTYSPNLPLRYLFYISDLYSVITKDMNLYGEKMVKIPTPKFIIFYNGQKKRPEKEVLKLSTMYLTEDESPSLELEAVLLNINPGYNDNLKSVCKSLRDYAEYTTRVREYAKRLPIEEAVEKAITECIREGILAEFLSKNRAEARSVSIYEYDAEKHLRMEREDAMAEGIARGKAEGKAEGIAEGMAKGKAEGVSVGRKELLLEQVKKKLARDKSVEVIAEELEEDVSTIQKIIAEFEN